MSTKIRVAFIYKKDTPYLSGKHFVNTIYHFWMNALKRNNRMEVTYFPTNDTFDATKLKNKIDAILLYQNHDLNMPKEISGIKELGIPVISGLIDPHHKIDREYFHEKYNIDCYVSIIPEKYFYRFYPSNFMYKQIFWGLEPSLYSQITPFSNRIKNKILNSGAVGNSKTLSKIINYIRKPHSNAYNQYKLRTKCNQLQFVDYTPTLKHEYVNDKYPLLLNKYCAAIAATTFSPTPKYLEIPASGCLTFMEVTELNDAKNLGFIDGESAIFIDEKNYVDKLTEYINDHDNKKWEEIAKAGRIHVMNNLTNDHAVNSLVDLMEKLQ